MRTIKYAMAKRVGGRADGSAGFPLALDVPVSEGEKGWRSRVQSRTLEGGRTRLPRRTYARKRLYGRGSSWHARLDFRVTF